jgi:ligand-binding sensor domain-containing protein/signal transduction histidine kinase
MKALGLLPALLGLIGLLAGPADGQTISPARVLGRYQQTVWKDQDGLPSNGIFSIARTPDGYLWLATAEGVVRFDGVRFTTFDTSNTPEIASNNVQALLVDRAGSLWIGTHAGGLTRYQDGRFTHLSTTAGLPDARVRCLYEDRLGAMWVGTDAGVAIFRDGSVTVYSTATGLPGNQVAAITGDPMGGIWIGTLSGLAHVRDGRSTTYTTRDGLAGNTVHALAWDGAGALWVGTDEGVSRFHDGVFTTYGPARGAKPVDVPAIAVDRHGTVWAGTAGDGLYRFDGGNLTTTRARDGLVDDIIQAIHEDPDGNLWLGAAEGLVQLKTGLFTTYTTRDGLPLDLVRPIYQDSSGTIWVGTDAGLARYADGRFVAETANDGRPYGSVTGITEARSGSLWIHTYRPSPAGNLVLRGQHPAQADAIDAGWSTRPFTAMLEDRSGALWFGTRTDGLHRLQGGSSRIYRTEDGLADHHVTRLFEDREGAVWIATAGGLSRFKDEHLTTFTPDDGFDGGHTLSFHEDRAGQLWIGTYGRGLYRYQDGRFAVITVRDGLYDNLAYQILEDDLGNLWMCGNKGIHRASLRELNEFADRRIPAVQSFAYGTADGMPSRECNGANPAGLEARDGRLWFPTMRGVAIVDPRQLDQRPPIVVIEGLSVDDQAQSLEDVRIRPGQENLEIQYTAISWNRAPQVRFKYQLEGLDRDWVEAGTRRTAYFPHLPPGAYTFRVIADNGEGVWNTVGKRLDIVVLPPFYRTWWFTATAGVSLLGLGYTGMTWRTAQLTRERNAQRAFSRTLLESQETERRRIAAELHDSLGQSLLIIKNRIALAQSDVADPEVLREQFDELSASASHAIDECREIAYNLRPYHLHRFGLTATLRALFMRIGEVTAIAASTDLDAIDDALSEEAQVNVYRIVQECVNNIIKHSHATEASLIVRRSGRDLTVVISDNGVGFPGTSSRPSADGTSLALDGFGLIGVAERVRMLGGRFEMESAAGATIRITLPAKAPEGS